MAPKTIVKSKDKLTDAEKKKIKAANKVKANPGKSKDKEVKNLERQYRRKQLERPEDIIEKAKTKKIEEEKAIKEKAKLDTEKLAVQKVAADRALRVAAEKEKAVQKAKEMKEGGHEVLMKEAEAEAIEE